MDTTSCVKCASLSKQCLELKNEISILNQKLENLMKSVLYERKDVSCQTNVTPSSNLACQTLFNYKDSCSQTESVATTALSSELSPNSHACSSEKLTNSFMLGDIDPYFQNLSLINESKDNALLNIYINANTNYDADQTFPSESTHAPPTSSNPVIPLIMLPYVIIPNKPFSNFELSKLNNDIEFERHLPNRSLCYYSEVGYSYNNIKHHPRPLPGSDNYLHIILDHLKNVIPDIKYNSVLLTKYGSGSDYIGFHSDNEPMIEPSSDIVTISLGETRVIQFRGNEMSAGQPEQSLVLNHGDVFVMSRSSQNFFQHAILSDSSKGPRISITLRLLKPNTYSAVNNLVELNPELIEPPASTPQNISPVESYTLYIGDSMIKQMDDRKMSSPSQKAVVLAYPGVTLGRLLSKLRGDQKFLGLDQSKIKKIYILCGANDVDKILGIPFSMNSELINMADCRPSDSTQENFKDQITFLADYLHNWADSASINFINILPRESLARNHIINTMNYHIKQLSLLKPFVNLVSTESHRSLFSFKDGNRKNSYFSEKGLDNVHLNNIGLIRLARYLKYFAHN